MTPQPPRWADRFLQWYCRPDRLEEIQGDAYELFDRTVKQSKRKADFYFIWNVLRFFRWRNIRRQNINEHSSQITLAMLKNYFTIGWRNLTKKKAFSAINIFGLAIGLTCFLLIAAFVVDELSYDRYAQRYKDIYRIGLQLEQNGGVDVYPTVDNAVGPGIKSDYPEIEEFTRLTAPVTEYIRHGDVNVKEEFLVFADSNVLEVFSIPLIEGNPANALTEPNSIVISAALAKKYFGDKPALGETLTSRRYGDMKITGIYDKIPDNSHFHYNGIISMAGFPGIKMRQSWSNIGFFTYLLLHEHADARALERKFPELVEKYVVPEIREDLGLTQADAAKTVNSWKFFLMPLSKIHLHSHTKYEIEPNGDINNVYIFGALAVFVLALACINFMNLSTAGSAKRSMEIGIRKTLGSVRSQLMAQFLVESMILAMIALVFAVGLVFLLLPFFNQLTGKSIEISFFLSPDVFPLVLALGISVGLLAGTYPALYLSSVKTLRVLKSAAPGGGGLSKFRSALVVFQFAISTALIIATIVAYQQLHYMQNIRLGYDKEQIVVVENAGALRQNIRVFKRQLEDDSRVANVTHSTVPMGSAGSIGGSEVSAKGRPESNLHAHFFTIDYDYVKTIGLEIVIGRNFSNQFPADSLGTNVIINETAMRGLGWNESNVLGSVIARSAQVHYTVVGVVKDFHYTSAKDKITPLIMLNQPWAPVMLVKVNTNEIPSFISDLTKQWASFETGIPFSYYFLDDRFSTLYKAEQTTEKIFIVFMIIAAVIASLGLYGLSTYSAEQRIKEIGIRKVLGSTVQQIVFLQSKEFLILVCIAILIAVPLSWYAMNEWLQNFGYRITINPLVFIVAGVGAIVIALITVSFQAIKAAVANPVKSLRTE